MADGDETLGRCLCGAIQYEFRGPPAWVVHCHCETCRRQVSSPVATFVGVARDAFRFTKGEPKVHVSSPGVRRSFCGTCGSPIAYEADRVPNEVHLFHGTLSDPAALASEAHVHVGEQLPWFDIVDQLPRYRAGRRGTAPVGRGPRAANGAPIPPGTRNP